MRLYGAIQKIEPQGDGTVRVEGIASSEATDDQDEIVRADAIRTALPNYLKAPALREMHQLSAAGTTLEAEVGEDGATRIVAHVVDPIAVLKVRNRVYRGFSIGGKVTARDSDNRKIITGLVLNEISLVDRPANPEAVFDCWKASDGDETLKGLDMAAGLATLADTEAGQKLAAIMPAPVQVWACGIADHQHAAKTEAVKCIEKRAATENEAEIDQVAEQAAGVVTSDGKGVTKSAAEVPEISETAMEGVTDPAIDVDKTSAAVSTEKATTTIDGEAAQDAEATAEALTPEEVEKRAQEGADEAQAIIDKALAAIERGERVLAEGEEPAEKGAEGAGAENALKLEEMANPAQPEAAETQDSELEEKSASPGAETPTGSKAAATLALKSMYDLGDVANAILFLDGLAVRLKWEAAEEGEKTAAADEARLMCGQMCTFLRNLVAHETAEIMAPDDSPDWMWLAEAPGNMRKAGLDAIADQIEKLGARNSARTQALLDAAYECASKAMKTAGCTKAMGSSLGNACKEMEAAGAKPWGDSADKTSESIGLDYAVKRADHQALMDMSHNALAHMTKGAVCGDVGKAGARHSKETMAHLTKAHGYLREAGANCDVAKDADVAMVAKATAGAPLELVLKMAGTLEDLAKELAASREETAKMAKRVEDIAQTPMPPAMVARPMAGSVSKSGDQPDLAALMSPEAIAKAWEAMSPNERAMASIKTAYANPMKVSGLQIESRG